MGFHERQLDYDFRGLDGADDDDWHDDDWRDDDWHGNDLPDGPLLTGVADNIVADGLGLGVHLHDRLADDIIN